MKLLQNFIQKIIKIDEKRSGRDQRSAATSIWQNIISCQQTNDKLREQKLNTRKSFFRLNFLKLSRFSASTKQGIIRVSDSFSKIQLEKNSIHLASGSLLRHLFFSYLKLFCD